MIKGLVIAFKKHYDHFISVKGYNPSEWPLVQDEAHLAGVAHETPVIVYGPAAVAERLGKVILNAHGRGCLVQYVPEV